MDSKKTGEFIALLRKSQGLTQHDVAARLGITDKTVSKWECGNGYPDITILPAIAELFRVTSDEILLGERINKDAEADALKKSKVQVGYLLRAKRHAINNMLVCSAGCGITAIIALFSLGQSTYNAPISCGVSVLLCIISIVIAVVAFSKAKLVTEDSGLKKEFPSEMLAFCRSVVTYMRFALSFVIYPLILNIIVWTPAYRMGGFLTVHNLTNPLYSSIAIIIAALVFFAVNKLLINILGCGAKKQNKL